MEYKTVEELKQQASLYENISTTELVECFTNNNVLIPDFVHRFVLVNALKKYVFNEEKLNVYSDEQKNRLKHYEEYSIYLLESLITKYSLEPLETEYKNLFMRFYLKNQKALGSTIALEESLKAIEGKNNANKTEFYTNCMDIFHTLYYTPNGYLDGLDLSIIKQSVCATYTLSELKEFGNKYEVKVPRRLSKEQLVDLVSARYQMSEEDKASLSEMSVLDITIYCKNRGFKISSDLKKGDMVEYIVYTLGKYHQVKDQFNFDFDILTDDEKNVEIVEQDTFVADDQDIPTEQAEVQEVEPKEEPVVEETPVVVPVEEVPEETPVEEVKEEEPAQEETPVVEEVLEETPVEEVKEEAEPVQEVQEEAEPQEETPVQEEVEEDEEESYEDVYDNSVDNEIKDIIKGYYNNKQNNAKKNEIIQYVLIGVLTVAVAVLFVLYFMK